MNRHLCDVCSIRGSRMSTAIESVFVCDVAVSSEGAPRSARPPVCDIATGPAMNAEETSK